MKEAVEIAKLRLFLKLVATVDADYRKPNLGLEPLPDIDFNIRAGNTLIGFADEADLDGSLRSTVEGVIAKPAIMEKMEMVSMAYSRFKDSQVTVPNYKTIKADKRDLNDRLRELNYELNQLLHKQTSSDEYDVWLETCQPFHWLAEYYEIIHDKGGFDVIVGNPPYVEYSKVDYRLDNYETLRCGNLYVYVIERCTKIIRPIGFVGMIVQLPIVCTDRMIPIQTLMKREFGSNYFSTFDDRPGKLFDGLEHIRATIFISSKGKHGPDKINTTKYIRWNSEFRPSLFEMIQYHENSFNVSGSFLKIGEPIQEQIFQKVYRKMLLSLSFGGDSLVYFHNAPQYWIRATDYIPYFWNEKDGQKASVQIKAIRLRSVEKALNVNSILNSSLFYLWFIALSDCRHLNMREIELFPISLESIEPGLSTELNRKVKSLMESYEVNKKRKYTYYKTTGNVEYDEYFPKKSKGIIDDIDKLLAKHYAFTDEELDFIVNYDIKYRMGRDLDGDSGNDEK